MHGVWPSTVLNFQSRKFGLQNNKSLINIIISFLVDLPASRNSAGTPLGYYRQADVLSISTNISVTSMIEKY